MEPNKSYDERVDVNFESHPPIQADHSGIAALLKQTLLHFIDCQVVAQYLIDLKDVTQVIAQEAPEEGSASEDEEPDDDIYGVSSVADLQHVSCRQISDFVLDKCQELKKLSESATDPIKLGFVINERYINLPPQLSLPTFKTLTETLAVSGYTHLIFISKILLKSKNKDTSLPNKKIKSKHGGASDLEPLVFVNPEEEIIFEQSLFHTDVDVSAYCDENASWSFGSDVRYKPHRRIMVIDFKDWPKTMQCLEVELNQAQ